MNLGERIKKVRRALDLTQQEFADRIGSKRNTVATYEVGRIAPSAAVISLICREFNVNETWLRTGEGEMFNPTEDDAVEKLCSDMHATELEAEIMRAYFKIDPDIRDTFMRRLIQGVQAQYATTTPQESGKTLEQEADEFAAMARQQFLEEKRRESQALSAGELDGAGPGGDKLA